MQNGLREQVDVDSISQLCCYSISIISDVREEIKRLRARNSVTLERSRLPTKSQHSPVAACVSEAGRQVLDVVGGVYS